MLKKAIFEESDYSLGLVTNSDPLKIPKGASPNCRNVHSNIFKTLQGRLGQKILNSSAASGLTGNGLYDYAVSELVRKQIGCFGGNIYYMDSLDGTWNSLKTGLVSSKFHFENFNNTLIICNKARDTGQYWDGSTPSTNEIATMPKGGFPIEFYNYLFEFDLKDTPRKARYSALNNHLSWPSGNVTGNLGPSGDIAYCAAKLRGYLYAFTDSSITRISYTYSAPLFSYRPITTKIGTRSPATIKVMNLPGMPEFLVFLGSDNKVYVFDGANPPIPVSDKIGADNKISEISMPTLNTNEIENFCAETIDELNWYVLCVSNRTSEENNWGLVFDFTSGVQDVSVWPFSNFSAGAISSILNPLKRKEYYISGYDGKTRRILYGNDDASSAINRLYDTRKIFHERFSVEKKYFQGELAMKTRGNFNLSFYFRINNDIDWSSEKTLAMYSDEDVLGDNLPLTLGSREITQHTIDLPRIANTMQFRYQTNSICPPFHIYRFEGAVEEQGIGKE